MAQFPHPVTQSLLSHPHGNGLQRTACVWTVWVEISRLLLACGLHCQRGVMVPHSVICTNTPVNAAFNFYQSFISCFTYTWPGHIPSQPQVIYSRHGFRLGGLSLCWHSFTQIHRAKLSPPHPLKPYPFTLNMNILLLVFFNKKESNKQKQITQK